MASRPPFSFPLLGHAAGRLRKRPRGLIRGDRADHLGVVEGLLGLGLRLYLRDEGVVLYPVIFRAHRAVPDEEVTELVTLELLDDRVRVIRAGAPDRIHVLPRSRVVARVRERRTDVGALEELVCELL